RKRCSNSYWKKEYLQRDRPGGSSKYKWKNKPADEATSRISSLAQL
ncbi:hypothetical protein A2U01_0045969, partial [Trifolium medium]|nr:hypothetical protein [Trifolium medium]